MPNRYYSGARSAHFDSSLFFNPEGRMPGGFRQVFRLLFGGGRLPWPQTWPSPFPQAKPQARVGGHDLHITMVGHASVLIQTAGLNLLTDPVWSERASPFRTFGPRRANPPGIRLEDLPRIDAVLLSHNHYDHMDLDTIGHLVRDHDPLIITPLGNDTIIKKAHPHARVTTGDWGDTVAIGEAAVHFEPAHHWSARGTRDRRMALWSAFLIETPGGKVYFAGDTGFHRGINFRALAAKHGALRFAFLPIGAYEPRWFMEPHHQNPEEAVEAFEILDPPFAGGYHWGTFQLTHEAVDAPREGLRAALEAKGIAPERFRALHPGEVWDIPALPVRQRAQAAPAGNQA